MMQSKSFQTKRSVLYLVFVSMIMLLLSCSLLLMPNYNPTNFSDSGLMVMLVERPKLTTNTTSPIIPDMMQKNSKGCNPDEAVLKVYMYDLPPMFHFGLLGWDGEGGVWPDLSKTDEIPGYPGGLNLQHSVEYWVTLDILSSGYPGFSRPCFATRVMNSSSANVIFVPFFSSLSYNRNSKSNGSENFNRDKFLQHELVKFLLARKEWKRSGGKDHVILAHHPNSMLDARNSLRSARFILADFGRYPTHVANVRKDIVAPYKHVVRSVGDESATFDNRPILAYFQGAIYRKDGGMIRQKLYQILKAEKDVHFTSGTVRKGGVRQAGKGMASSKFCLNIAGDTPSSNRLFDAIVSHCVPVIISDHIELPFEDILDYSEFSIFVRSSDATKKKFLVNLLRQVGRDEWTKMWERLRQIAHHYEYQSPSQPEDAVQMIWQAITRKVSRLGSDTLLQHVQSRYHRSKLSKYMY